jgi:predicted  nucleic acid-binding Zn-ribbon protein
MPTMTYAQALTEAKQTIVQQQLRIKADAEKVRSLQQSVAEQSAVAAENDRRLNELSTELQRLVEESQVLGTRLQEATTAKEHAEAVVDRQGERLTHLQEVSAGIEKRVAEQADRIAELTTILDQTRVLLPTREDEDALASMSDLLSRRSAAIARKAGVAMRMADDAGSEAAEPMVQAEAA